MGILNDVARTQSADFRIDHFGSCMGYIIKKKLAYDNKKKRKAEDDTDEKSTEKKSKEDGTQSATSVECSEETQ